MIFIDVDGTLIDDNDRPRPFVMAAAWLLLARNIHGIVVWSGGGSKYAEQWARRLFFGHGVSAIAKDPLELRAGDVVVDDMLEFRVPDGVFLKTPDEFSEWALDA